MKLNHTKPRRWTRIQPYIKERYSNGTCKNVIILHVTKNEGKLECTRSKKMIWVTFQKEGVHNIQRQLDDPV